MKSSEQVTAEAFAALDEHLRPASIAEIGGFRPPSDPTSSKFGGIFVGRSDESWPQHEGQEMLPLIQIRTDELPYRPPTLDDIALLTVFINPRKIRTGRANGDGWALRAYSSLANLVPLPPPSAPSPIKPFPIRWHLNEHEGPNWEEAWERVDLSDFNDLAKSAEASAIYGRDG